MMTMIWPQTLIVFLLALCTPFASVLAQSKIEIDLLYKSSVYEELRDQQRFLDKNIAQAGPGVRLLGSSLVLGRWLLAEAEAEYIAGPLTATQDLSYTQMSYGARVGIVLPARPLNVTLIAETYHRTMDTSDQSFGYDKFSEMRYYPLLEYTFANGSRFFLKYPLFKSLSRINEIHTGFHWRINASAAAYPENTYQKSWLFKVEYSDEELRFRSVRNVDIKTRTWTVGIGYSF
jgi:hypothetical protein